VRLYQSIPLPEEDCDGSNVEKISLGIELVLLLLFLLLIPLSCVDSFLFSYNFDTPKLTDFDCLVGMSIIADEEDDEEEEEDEAEEEEEDEDGPDNGTSYVKSFNVSSH
jgi:hypothetical protein